MLTLRFSGGNQLTEIPPSICDLSNLRTLNVANNKLKYLPAEMHRLQLTELAVDPNPFLENTEAAKDKSRDRYVGPVERRYAVIPLFEFALRILVAPATPQSHLTAISSLSISKTRPKTVFEHLYDLPLSTEESSNLSPHIRETLAACIPGSIGHTISPHTSPAQSQNRTSKSPPCVSTCMSRRHLIDDGPYKPAVFVDHAEQRFTWDKFVAGRRVGGDNGIPLLWRGCSPGCLDFLDETAGTGADDDDVDWTMDVDDCANVDASPAKLESVASSQPASEFGQFAADDIDLDD